MISRSVIPILLFLLTGSSSEEVVTPISDIDGDGCPNMEGEWFSRDYDAFYLSNATAVANSTLLKDQSFTLVISDQHINNEEEGSSCYFSATMSNKPGVQIAGHFDKETNELSMIHTKNNDPGGYAVGYLDDTTDVLTFTFLQGYNTAEAFETQLARRVGDGTTPSPPAAIPCPELSADSTWVSKFPFNSILLYDTGKARLTYTQNQTFYFQEKEGCNFFAFNAWISEREGGPNNQEVVGVVSSRLSKKGEIQIYAAQLGPFASFNMPMPITADGRLNYYALTPHTGGPLYDYFSMPETEEFFDPQYLTVPLTDNKVVQGVDLDADFTDPYLSNSELNTGNDMWQVQMFPVDLDPPLDIASSDPTTPFGFDRLSEYFGTGTNEERQMMVDNCASARSVIGTESSEWKTSGTDEAASMLPDGTFQRFGMRSKLLIDYWAPSSTTSPTAACYFAGVHTYNNAAGQEIVAAITGTVDGGSDATEDGTLHMEMNQGGPCKATIIADVIIDGLVKAENNVMKITYACSSSHWESNTNNDPPKQQKEPGVIFSTTLERTPDPQDVSTSLKALRGHEMVSLA